MEDSLYIGADPDNKEFPIALFLSEDSDEALGMSLEEAKDLLDSLTSAIAYIESSMSPKH